MVSDDGRNDEPYDDARIDEVASKATLLVAFDSFPQHRSKNLPAYGKPYINYLGKSHIPAKSFYIVNGEIVLYIIILELSNTIFLKISNYHHRLHRTIRIEIWWPSGLWMTINSRLLRRWQNWRWKIIFCKCHVFRSVAAVIQRTGGAIITHMLRCLMQMWTTGCCATKYIDYYITQ